MNLGRPDRSDRLDALAGAYALGTLSARVRSRLARIARVDATVAEAVRAWELRLAKLADGLPGITPPPRVWEGIRKRLGLKDEPTGTSWAGDTSHWWASLPVWRGLALAGFALAFALGVTLFAPKTELPAESIVVVLAGQDGKPALVATSDRESRYLTIKNIAALGPGPGRSLELWMLPDGRAPRSLGLIRASGIDRIALPAAAGSTLQGIPALAVSLEPAGGSPTGAPTGPVLYTGRVDRFY